MCTIIVAWQVFADLPIIIAANRDELVTRPSDPPLLLADDPPRWGGRDRLASGTWLAVDPAGRVGAVTNRHPGGRPPERDATRASRGSLPLDVLAGDDDGALRLAESLEPARFNPVNVVYVSRSLTFATALDDDAGRRTARLRPGVHVMTEQDVDDAADAKTQDILRRAGRVVDAAAAGTQAVSGLRELLRSHDPVDGGSPVCVHSDLHGTVSSSIVLVSATGGVRYEHADGPPCVTPFDRII